MVSGKTKASTPTAVIPREGGESSTPRLLRIPSPSLGYWIARPSRAMTLGVWPPTSSSSLRAQRSNPDHLRGGTLDCFAALAM